MIPITRHLQYTRGFIDLGMVNEASDELEQINWDDPGLRISYGRLKGWQGGQEGSVG